MSLAPTDVCLHVALCLSLQSNRDPVRQSVQFTLLGAIVSRDGSVLECGVDEAQVVSKCSVRVKVRVSELVSSVVSLVTRRYSTS